ncbi:MAG: NAD(P)H-hydrate epimerase [Candidatus Parvarchaeota archaeon]|nr:NAD(P)H-hydrate epimerase [Candidatus Parvarchaeota archaeon]MCW1295845.1 NAD(P)H-hydrate epimerase [Candidatus Parvarchaeum tengchongense]MCW1298996.1 NAD(P)H-hydrate epimerase [Candidatus Parvarchaeum tengchongense]MCW1312350.1 NAD(P)H-hydrate epimerase [Candidatus Parvarchaeum tengchongense]
MEYYSIAEIKKIEEEAIRKGMTEEKMMDTAGHLVADFIHNAIEFKKAVFIAGTGNNGGDTLSAAFHLFNLNHPNIEVIIVGKQEELKEGPKTFLYLINDIKDIPVSFVSDTVNLEHSKETINNADLLVVGIFGTGFHGDLPDLTAGIIDLINDSNAKKVSIDIPSGMNGDTGEFKKAVKSDFTLTMMAMKKAFQNPAALNITGKIFVMDLLA